MKILPDWIKTEMYDGLEYPIAPFGALPRCPYVCTDEDYYDTDKQHMLYPINLRVYDIINKEHLYLEFIKYEDINKDTRFLSVDFYKTHVYEHIKITRWAHFAKGLENNLIFFKKAGDQMKPDVFPKGTKEWSRDMLAPYYKLVSRSKNNV
jgi:hypothetical protein